MAWRFGDRGRGPKRPWTVCGRGRGSRNFGVGPWTLVGVGSGRGPGESGRGRGNRGVTRDQSDGTPPAQVPGLIPRQINAPSGMR